MPKYIGCRLSEYDGDYGTLMCFLILSLQKDLSCHGFVSFFDKGKLAISVYSVIHHSAHHLHHFILF